MRTRSRRVLPALCASAASKSIGSALTGCSYCDSQYAFSSASFSERAYSASAAPHCWKEDVLAPRVIGWPATYWR